MFLRLSLLAFVALLALMPAAASADDGNNNGFILRARGTFTLPTGESIGSAVVIKGDAVIAGTVDHSLVVIDGSALIGGQVKGNLTVIKGDVTLESGSHVKRVNIVNGHVNREAGSLVDHGINQRHLGFGFLSAIFFWILWLGMTATVIIGGLVFAAIAGRQLSLSTRVLTGELAFSILGAVVVWIGLPVLALLAFLSVIGIPFGLALLLIALPALWFLGYLVTGARLGEALLSLGGHRPPAGHPYIATALGLIVLQLAGLVPLLGWAVMALAGIWGSGALGVTAFRAWQGRGAALLSKSPTGN